MHALRRSAFVIGLVLATVGMRAGAEAAPVIQAPVVAVYYANTGTLASTALVITGQNFGSSSTVLNDTYVRVTAPGHTYTLQSGDPEVIGWHPNRIILHLGVTVSSGSVKVVSGGVASAVVPIDTVFHYDWFDVPPAPETVGLPGALALDPSGKIWVNALFHRAVYAVDPVAQTVNGVSIPVLPPPDPGPFASTLNIFGGPPVDIRTPFSVENDSLIVVNGKVWFTEGGESAYKGVNPNHSRILQYDPSTSTYHVYNVPGDNNAVSGLTYLNGRIWFASSAHEVENYIENGQPQRTVGHVPAKLVSFDPNQVPSTDGTSFDYSHAPLALVCASGANEASCYHEYPFTDDPVWPYFNFPNGNPTRPGNILPDGAGNVWFTDFGGAVAPCALFADPGAFCPASGLSSGNNLIGRVHPTTVVGMPSIDQYPLPAPISLNTLAAVDRSGPSSLAVASDGDILLSETFDSTLARLDVAMLSSGNCTQLNGSGTNPCIQELVIPEANYPGSFQLNYEAVDLADEGVQGVALDSTGKLWFAQTGPNQPNRSTSLGYVKADWSGIVRLPPIGVFPGKAGFNGAGVAIGTSGEIWFADFTRQRVGRLRAG